MSESPKLKVFISYSRADAAFADELVAGLEFKEEFAVTIDRHSIVEGEDWKKRLGGLIADADTIVFILSPDSAQSRICAWEVDEAHSLSKRIIPVLFRPTGAIPAPPQLAALNYVRFDEGRSFMGGLTALANALKTDVDWLREHTRLLTRAMEWDASERPINRLLSGNDIAAAKQWLARRPKDAPQATALHLDFISASERAEEDRRNAERRQLEEIASAQSQRSMALQEREAAVTRLQMWTRRGLVAASAAAAGGAGLAFWGFDAERRVRREQENARKAAAEALENAIEKEAMREDLAGQLVVFAAAPGQYAEDGPAGGNSPFTAAMTEALSNRSVSLQGAIARSNKRVLDSTTGRQRPYLTSDINGDVYFFRMPPARRRIALAISVDGVPNHPATLNNVARDAARWATLLRQAGFETTVLTNPKHDEMRRALGSINAPARREGSGSLGNADVRQAALGPLLPTLSDALVVVFYSGVGLTFRGLDYLAASDTRIDPAAEIQATAIELRGTLADLRERNKISVMAIDTNFTDYSQTR
jgi:hypothetical protein